MGTGKTARNSALIIKTCQVQNLVMGVPTLEEISNASSIAGGSRANPDVDAEM